MKKVLLKLPFWLGFALANVLCAASGDAPRVAPKPDPAQQSRELAAQRAAFVTAKAHALNSNVAAAEQALVAVNKAKPNNAHWHIETAQRLVQLADQLAREGKPASVPALANSALQHLGQVDALTKSAQIKASAKALAGFVQERLLGNRTAALASYQAAAQLSPTSRQAAEAADRLKRTDDNLRTRFPGGAR